VRRRASAEFSVAQLGSAELGTVENGVGQVGIAEVTACDVRLEEVRSLQGCVVEIGTAQLAFRSEVSDRLAVPRKVPGRLAPAKSAPAKLIRQHRQSSGTVPSIVGKCSRSSSTMLSRRPDGGGGSSPPVCRVPRSAAPHHVDTDLALIGSTQFQPLSSHRRQSVGPGDADDLGTVGQTGEPPRRTGTCCR